MKESYKKKLDTFCRYSSAVLIIGVFLLTFSYLLSIRDVSLSKTKVNYIEKFTYNDGTKAAIWNFISPDSKGTDIYSMIEASDLNNVLFIQTTNTFLNIYLNDELIYEDTDNGFGRLNSNGAKWRKINIRPHANNMILKITCIPAYKDNKCEIDHLYYGDPDACVHNVLSEHLPALIINGFFIILSFISFALFLYYYCKYKTGRDFLFIGNATLITALWSILDTKMFPFFWGNSEVFQILSYIVFLMIPISFGLIAAYRFKGTLKVIANIYTLISDINLVISVFLYLMLYVDFYYTKWLNIGIIILGIPLLATLLFTYQEDEKLLKSSVVIYTFSIVVVSCIIMWLSRLYKGYNHDSSYIVRTSIVCLQFCLIFHHSKITAIDYRQRFEAKIRHEFDIHDRVTGFYNRTALVENSSKYVNVMGKCTYGIAYFSLRHVKQINESYGYEEGTKLIQDFTSGLHSSFPDTCDFYRIGNRKFFVLIPGNDPEDIYVDARNAIELFCNESNEFRNHEYKMTYTTSFAHDPNATLYNLMDLAESRA